MLAAFVMLPACSNSEPTASVAGSGSTSTLPSPETASSAPSRDRHVLDVLLSPDNVSGAEGPFRPFRQFVLTDIEGNPMVSEDDEYPEFHVVISSHRNEDGSNWLFYSMSNADNDGYTDCGTWEFGLAEPPAEAKTQTILFRRSPDGYGFTLEECSRQPTAGELSEPFRSTFTLSASANPNQITVNYDGGVSYLTLTEPKAAALEAPPNLEPAPFGVQPAIATAGGFVEINYPEPTSRGGYYFLHQWTADGWSEPTHLIETDGNGSPRIYTAGVDDFAVEDYGLLGAGSETAPLPDVPAGFWMLCETNNPDTWCARLEIAG